MIQKYVVSAQTTGLICLCALVVCLCVPLRAESEEPQAIVLKAVKDTYVEHGNDRDDNNNGASNFAAKVKSFMHRRFESIMLVEFDLSSLPEGEVKKATLRLWVPADERAEHSKNADFHVFAMNDSWAEGSGTGTIGEATGDGATWNTRDGAEPWTGGSTIATDLQSNGSFDAQPVTTIVHPENWGAWSNSWVEFDVTPLVNAWVNKARENKGLAIATRAHTPEDRSVFMMFATREYNKESAKPGEKTPQLVVMY